MVIVAKGVKYISMGTKLNNDNSGNPLMSILTMAIVSLEETLQQLLGLAIAYNQYTIYIIYIRIAGYNVS